MMTKTTYTVTVTVQFPAWDEQDGILIGDFEAHSKAEAIRKARLHASGYGHTMSIGRHWFRATESASAVETDTTTGTRVDDAARRARMGFHNTF